MSPACRTFSLRQEPTVQGNVETGPKSTRVPERKSLETDLTLAMLLGKLTPNVCTLRVYTVKAVGCRWRNRIKVDDLRCV